MRKYEVKTNPITIEVIRNHMITTCREMGVAMMRTSYSPMFNEALDFSCVVFDRHAEMVAQAEFCPAHIGAIVHTVEWCVKEVGPENMEDGDVILHNDPYRGGCHLPEFMVLKPMFYEGEIVAYTANIAHMTDVGGSCPASFGRTTSIFEEGIRLPPVKIYKNNREVEDIFRIIISNVRTPRNAYGDVKAMIGSLYLAERRIRELIDKYGLDVFKQCCEDIKNLSEMMMREEIDKMPDGEYEFEGYLEDDGVVPDKKWKIKVTVVIRGDELVADYTGSDSMAQGSCTQTFGCTASATYNAVFHLTDPTIPFNHGCYRPIGILAPPGSFVNVDYPGSCVGGNSDTYPTTVDIILSAFSKVIPEKTSACDGGTCGCIGIGGVHPETGDPYVHLHLDGVGWGGRFDHDGNDSVFVKNGNCANTPVEVFETRYPIRVKEYNLKENSAGAGKYRGGFGTRRTFEFLAPVTVSAHTNRHIVNPWGLFGGKEGGNTTIKIKKKGSTEFKGVRELYGTVSPGKFSNIVVSEGDELLYESPGGGGYGSPFERDPELVLNDFVNGLISLENVKENYGVIIDAKNLKVDYEATETLRRRRKASEVQRS